MHRKRTYRHEQLVHIRGRLSRCLHEHNACLVHIRLRVLALHLPLDAQIRLVPRQRYHDVRVTLPLQLLDPRLRPLKRLLSGEARNATSDRVAGSRAEQSAASADRYSGIPTEH